MAINQNIISTYTDILKEELLPAMGCTEPIAIAYSASILRHALGNEPESIKIGLSGNIIKNVKSVIVPATGGLFGIPAAVAAGIISGAPERRLEVLCGINECDREKISEFISRCKIEIYELESVHPFEIDIFGTCGDDTARAHLAARHTNVISVDKNGIDLTESYRDNEPSESGEFADRSLLNVEDIVEFARTAPLDSLAPILRAEAQMNMAIAEEGIKNAYGASIGKLLYAGGNCDLKTRARAYAAAGSDARMSGCEMPVCILSGSGNQGMTASIPVIIYANAWGKSEEEMLRALLVSDLITIHQKTGIGCLSAYCGAISAGCGCGCGIAFLDGGGYSEIAHTLVNSVAILSGTICDGAKASCAAKIAMAVDAGIMGYEMMKSGREFVGGDGIVTKGVENTLQNIGRLARDGMSETDKEIIRIMLS